MTSALSRRVEILPRKTGREVLGEIKGDEELKLIPVVSLTSSRAEVDVHRAYGLHANCYITKPGTSPASWSWSARSTSSGSTS